MTDKKYELSRRKALLGLGTIGAAGAAAGLGTSALFTDEEEFEDNSITAGTLDMAVTGEIVAANDEYENNVTDITGNPIEANGDVEVGFQLEDFKPGDWFIMSLTVDSVAENPFYLTIHGDADEYREKEGASTEPEMDVDTDTTDNGWESVTDTNAELGDKLLMSYWEEWGGTAPSEDGDNDPNDGSGDRTDLSSMDNITNTEDNSLYSGSWQDSGEDGVVTSGTLGYTDAREFYFGLDTDGDGERTDNDATGNDPLGNGFASGDGILVGGSTDPVQVGADAGGPQGTTRRRMSDPDGDGEAELVFYLLVELPEEVGNEVQGDGVRGNLRFSAEQVRNNGDPRSGN